MAKEIDEKDLEKVTGGMQNPTPTTVIGYYCPFCDEFYYSLSNQEGNTCKGTCGGKIVKNAAGVYRMKLGPDLKDFIKA